MSVEWRVSHCVVGIPHNQLLTAIITQWNRCNNLFYRCLNRQKTNAFLKTRCCVLSVYENDKAMRTNWGIYVYIYLNVHECDTNKVTGKHVNCEPVKIAVIRFPSLSLFLIVICRSGCLFYTSYRNLCIRRMRNIMAISYIYIYIADIFNCAWSQQQITF